MFTNMFNMLIGKMYHVLCMYENICLLLRAERILLRLNMVFLCEFDCVRGKKRVTWTVDAPARPRAHPGAARARRPPRSVAAVPAPPFAAAPCPGATRGGPTRGQGPATCPCGRIASRQIRHPGERGGRRFPAHRGARERDEGRGEGNEWFGTWELEGTGYCIGN